MRFEWQKFAWRSAEACQARAFGMRKQEIAQIKLASLTYLQASRGTPQNHTHPAPSPPGGKTGPKVRFLGHLAPYECEPEA